jgi:transposase-like protein
MGPRLNAGKEQHWLDHVCRWQRSQLTVREFCRRHHLREANFYAWRRVLRRRGLFADSPITLDATPAFVKVTVDEEPTPPATPVEVVLGERRVLRVRAGFDADLLLQLVQLLEEPGC